MRRSLMIFIIKCFRTIVFIFIIISIRILASKETIILTLQVQSWLQTSKNTEILNTCTRLWLTESEQTTSVDSIKGVVRCSVKVLEFEEHLKKAGWHISRNVLEITIKMKTMVQKPLMIKKTWIIRICYKRRFYLRFIHYEFTVILMTRRSLIHNELIQKGDAYVWLQYCDELWSADLKSWLKLTWKFENTSISLSLNIYIYLDSVDTESQT